MIRPAPRGPGKPATSPRNVRSNLPRGLAGQLGTIPRVSQARKPAPPTPGKPARPATRRPATHAPASVHPSTVSTAALAARMPPLALPRRATVSGR